MQLRLLTAADAEQFQAVRLRGLAECPTAFASSYDEESANTVDTVRQRLAPANGRAIVGAFAETTLVGLLGLRRETMKKMAHKAYAWGMYVVPEQRKAGLGEALVRLALSHAREWGVRQVNLGVNADNMAALALYTKLGFTTFGIERDFLFHDGRFYDECQMACLVPGAA